MPGPVSDSYDPEFGTSEIPNEIFRIARNVNEKISFLIGVKFNSINNVVTGKPGLKYTLILTEQQLRVVRYCLNRAIDTL